jgi:hypothetical protein
MDTRETRRVTMTVNMQVTLTLDVVEGDDGAEVVSVREVDLPEGMEVMEALDHEGRFEELDQLYAAAKA